MMADPEVKTDHQRPPGESQTPQTTEARRPNPCSKFKTMLGTHATAEGRWSQTHLYTPSREFQPALKLLPRRCGAG
jgi:hypothetical protein